MKSSFRRGNNGYIGVNQADEFYSGIQSVSTRRIYQDLEEWNRPDYWLKLPDLTANDQKLCMLLDIFKGASGNTGATADSNFIGFTISGNYIVDWGNGITQSFTGGTRAQYQYNFENISSNTQTPEGTRQVIIQVYPQAGATLTSINLSTGFQGVTLASGFATGYNTGLIDLKVAGRSINSFTLHVGNNNQWHQRLAQFEYVGPSSLTSCGFARSYGLRKVIGTEWTKTFTSLAAMFFDCARITSIPAFETSNVTSTVSMFAYSGIRNIPLIDTSKVTNFTSMFEACGLLQTIPPLNTSSATNMTAMFISCGDLRYVPDLDTRNVTNMNQMFRGCGVLQKAPKMDTSKVTDMTYMFLFCGGLQEIPNYDTSNVTNFQGMLRNCPRVKKIPNFNTSKATTMTELFYGGPSVPSPPKLDTSKVTNFTNMYNTGNYLHIPEMDGSSGTNFSSIFANAQFTSGGIIKNIGASISYAGIQMMPGNLNAIFDNLRSGVSGPTITITNCLGATGCDRTKATSKGWTVIG